jgi:hypothetical protein
MPAAMPVPFEKKLSSEVAAPFNNKEEGSVLTQAEVGTPLFGVKICTPFDTETNTVPALETIAWKGAPEVG